MARKTKSPTPETTLLDGLRSGRGKKKRRLTAEEREALIKMLAIKVDPDGDFDIQELVPQGSYIARMLRHFQQTDISYALPLMQLVMIASSWLTQKGASVTVPGVGEISPTLWTVGLAGSGESKTLATDEVRRILSGSGQPPVELLPTGSTDAQWIEDLAVHNGSYWLQDEVGKYFKAVLTSSNHARMKPWILDAYSYQTISNRLKGEKQKRVIERPMFTFLGLSVFSTWKMDVDVTSMLDGFCQRMNFFLAKPRSDTDMYDHFLYFTGPEVERRKAELFELWQALCAQDNAAGAYELDPLVLPFLEEWWRSLRKSWGDSPLPGSFIRRIGFSVMRYLPTLHFLLGKSRRPIDIETAHLATRFAEYHMRCALTVLQDYDCGGAGQIQKVAALRGQLLAEGRSATARNITRRLSASQRANLPTEMVSEILAVLNGIEDVPGLIDADMEAKEKSGALIGRLSEIRDRLALTERKRNERRLRILLKEFRRRSDAEGMQNDDDVCSSTVVVVDFLREPTSRPDSEEEIDLGII